MLNIQFMKDSQATINNRGDKVYIPDYESLKANACCDEERAAIDRCKELFEKTGRDGFTFAIVYTHYGKIWDPYLKKNEYGWTIYQHPWYQSYNDSINGYIKDSKEDMIKEIALQEAREMKII